MKPIYDGWTPLIKKCTKCGKVEAMVNDFCFDCRQKERINKYYQDLAEEKQKEKDRQDQIIESRGGF